MRFHQAVAFLPTRQILPLAKARDGLGYGGMYVSDHLFNPRERPSRYTYSKTEDGAPGWEDDTAWPDPMCLISAWPATDNLLFTTGIYIAPLRDLMTVAKTVGTAAVLSDNRLRLGIGVGWSKEEFDLTGQDFANRGKRLDEMIVALRALWARRLGRVPRRLLRRPGVPDGALAHRAGAVHRRRPLGRCPATRLDPLRRVGEHRSGQPGRRLHPGRENQGRGQGGPAGRAMPFAIYVAVKALPDLDLYRRLEDAGVTDLLCAPWMGVQATEADTPESLHAARLAMCEQFAEHIIGPMS